jgi:hypothetical protein
MCRSAIAPVGRAADPERQARVVRVLSTGAAAAGAAFTGFFVAVHSSLIAPIWDRSAHGLPFALLVGIAMAWALWRGPSRHTSSMRPDRRSLRARVSERSSSPRSPPTLFANPWRLAGLHANDWPGVVISLAIAAGAGAAAGCRARERTAATIALTVAIAGQIPAASSARAAWLFAAFLPICGGAGIALAVSRRWCAPAH